MKKIKCIIKYLCEKCIAHVVQIIKIILYKRKKNCLCGGNGIVFIIKISTIELYIYIRVFSEGIKEIEQRR